jgi:hypothetical protein
MKVSTRKFIREFSRFRSQARQGEPVVIEGRDGTRFLFHVIGGAAGPGRCKEALPRSVTDRWDLDSPAIEARDWSMNT